jgi:hypothetical protein
MCTFIAVSYSETCIRRIKPCNGIQKEVTLSNRAKSPSIFDAGEGTRTPTPSRETDFESVASAIPPHRHMNKVKAPPRFELGVKLLQSSALPLGYGALMKH